MRTHNETTNILLLCYPPTHQEEKAEQVRAEAFAAARKAAAAIPALRKQLAAASGPVQLANFEHILVALSTRCTTGLANVVEAIVYSGNEYNSSVNYGDSRENVAALLALGADPCEVIESYEDGDRTNHIPLHEACRRGKIDVVKELLNHEDIQINQLWCENPDYRDEDMTALACVLEACTYPSFRTTRQKMLAIAKLLLAQKGIDVNAPAFEYEPMDPPGIKKRYGVAQPALIMETPLQHAVRMCMPDMVRLLLANDGVDASQDLMNSLLYSVSSGDFRRNIDSTNNTWAELRDDDNLSERQQNGTYAYLEKYWRCNYASHPRTSPQRNALDIAQTLVVYGASLTAPGGAASRTPIQDSVHPDTWLTVEGIEDWSPLQLAAALRLHAEAAAALRQGKMDPDAASILQIMAAIETSKVEANQLPWVGAPPICKETIKLVADATRGWRPATHWLYHENVRNIVQAVLMIGERLEKRPRANGTAMAAHAAEPALPMLPDEIWKYAMGFLQRSWWAVH